MEADKVRTRDMSGQENKRRIVELLKQVNKAFNEAPFQTPNSVLGNTEEQLQLARKQKEQLTNLPDDTILNFGAPEDLPGEVFTNKYHEYPVLMQMAIEKLISTKNCAWYNADKARHLGKKAVEHEFEHAIKGWNQDGLKFRYGVRFFKSRNNGKIGITPIIQTIGSIKLAEFKNIVNGASVLSASDHIQLGKVPSPEEIR